MLWLIRPPVRMKFERRCVMTDAQWVLFASGLGSAFTSWFTVRNANRREARQREWAVEDRAAAAQERKEATAQIIAEASAKAEALLITTKATASALALEGKRTAAKLREDMRISSNELESRLNEVHQTATAGLEQASSAYKEANHVNMKISDWNERLLAQGGLKLEGLVVTAGENSEKLDSIETKVDTIVERKP
jgi:hypothetical protein